jgi:hypothetical protein
VPRFPQYFHRPHVLRFPHPPQLTLQNYHRPHVPRFPQYFHRPHVLRFPHPPQLTLQNYHRPHVPRFPHPELTLQN